MTARMLHQYGHSWGILLLLSGGCMLLGCTGCVPAVGQERVTEYTTSPGPHKWIAFGELDPFGTAPEPGVAVVRRSPPISEMPAVERVEPPPNGAKYRKLMRKIEVEEDQSTYGEFYDYGYWSGTSWRGHGELPPGYWVYVAPHWYIYGEAQDTSHSPAAPPQLPGGRGRIAQLLTQMRDLEQQVGSLREELEQLLEPPPSPPLPSPARPKRSWGPEQATGPPDTPSAGDISTAWASRTSDGQDEWLRLHFAQAVIPAGIHVYETYNPGALYRVTATSPSGKEIEIWSGKDPVEVGSGKGVAAVPVQADFATDRVTIYLKSTEVSGWNEIDAVGLLDNLENIQWAVTAEASSTWASP